MKRYFILFVILLGICSQGIAKSKCFIAQENEKVLIQEGNCDARHAPCSTFKIALALMGFDANILTDEIHPQWNFKPGYVEFLESWKQPQNPRTWLKQSCVWYSQVLTQRLGMEKFQEYVAKFKYGNQDISGDKGQNNGLTNCWLSGSLKISGSEQLKFLQDLLNNALPVSERAHKLTRKILFVEDLPDGWKLYGKTGSGYVPNTDGTLNKNLHTGWFIGWIEKQNRKISFVHYMENNEKSENGTGSLAREIAKEKVLKLLSYTNQYQSEK